MTMIQPSLTFPSAPIDADTKATVELVANDHMADWDWVRFEQVVRHVAFFAGEVDPNRVRGLLTDANGELVINPRRLSAFYHRAAGKSGFLDFSHWGINHDTKGRPPLPRPPNAHTAPNQLTPRTEPRK